MMQLPGKLPARLFLVYALVELWRMWRFRRLLRRLRARRYAHKGGSGFLAWARGVLFHQEAPFSIDREIMERYAKETSVSVGYGGGSMDWRRLYAWWAWGCGRPFDPPHDAELHSELLACCSASCSSMGLEGPPEGAAAPDVRALAPFGFGICEIRATFKPLPLRAFLRGVQQASRLAIRSLGLRRIVEPMPGGELVCWTDLPPARDGHPVNRGGGRPVLFLHGLGLGNFTYLPLFFGEHGKAWRSSGVVMVELPCMTSATDVLEGMPQAVHFADAIGRLMRDHLGYGDFEYDIVCHSLSAYLAAILANEGSPCQPLRTVLIDPVCFLEGVEVCSRFPFRTPQECREFAEKTVLFPSFLPGVGRRMLGRVFRQFVCRDVFTQFSVLRWNGTDATSIFWRNTSAEALVCLSDDDHFVPSDRVARHCKAHFPKLKTFHMPGKDHGSFVIEASLRAEMLQRVAHYLAKGE